MSTFDLKTSLWHLNWNVKFGFEQLHKCLCRLSIHVDRMYIESIYHDDSNRKMKLLGVRSAFVLLVSGIRATERPVEFLDQIQRFAERSFTLIAEVVERVVGGDETVSGKLSPIKMFKSVFANMWKILHILKATIVFQSKFTDKYQKIWDRLQKTEIKIQEIIQTNVHLSQPSIENRRSLGESKLHCENNMLRAQNDALKTELERLLNNIGPMFCSPSSQNNNAERVDNTPEQRKRRRF